MNGVAEIQLLIGQDSSDRALEIARNFQQAGQKVCYVRFCEETFSTCGYTFTSNSPEEENFSIISYTEESCYADPEVQKALAAYAAYDYVKDNYLTADLFILDGLLAAVNSGYIKESELNELLEEKPAQTLVVLTSKTALN